MNSRILTQSWAQKQDTSSMNDDPFGIGIRFVQGMTNMSHQKRLESYMEDLVSQYATYEDDAFILHLVDIPLDEQSELLRLYIESIDREIEAEAIYGNDFSINSDYNCALLSVLQANTLDNQKNLSNVIQKNILNYYSESLQGMLDGACESYLCDRHELNNTCIRYDRDHGDAVICTL